MMGLEPTTFCMASGSWVRSFLGATRVFMRDCAYRCASDRPRKCSPFPGDSWGFGQRKRLAAQTSATPRSRLLVADMPIGKKSTLTSTMSEPGLDSGAADQRVGHHVIREGAALVPGFSMGGTGLEPVTPSLSR